VLTYTIYHHIMFLPHRDASGQMKRMACKNSRWKAANQWKDWRI